MSITILAEILAECGRETVFGVLARGVRVIMSISTPDGIQECVEHSSIVWEAIKTGKVEMRDLHVLWLDLANAYGSILHDLVQKALQYYHISEWVANIVLSNYIKTTFFIRILNEGSNVTMDED